MSQDNSRLREIPFETESVRYTTLSKEAVKGERDIGDES